VNIFERYSTHGEPGPRAVEAFVVQYLREHKQASRREMNDALVAEWKRASGRNFEHEPMSKLKKALIATQRRGEIRSLPMHGYYGICDDDERGSDGAPFSLAERDSMALDALRRAEAVVGEGREYVYAFYIAAYREAAVARGEASWAIKIGRSYDYVARMNAHRTALPDAPVIALLMLTDDAARLEKAIHGVLSFRGRSYVGNGGSEWYSTTPDEIRSAYLEIAGGKPGAQDG
jgi:hypothetical protein